VSFRHETLGRAARVDPEWTGIAGRLLSYVLTRDLARVLRVADALDTGMTGINRGVVSNAAGHGEGSTDRKMLKMIGKQ
jgi:succinate-semialdehyde dehydrogenase/glutarate-semialdehyde dehydrogenase